MNRTQIIQLSLIESDQVSKTIYTYYFNTINRTILCGVKTI